MIQFEKTLLQGNTIPLVWQITHGANADINLVAEWVVEHKAGLISDRLKHGAVLIRGLRSVDSAKQFATFLKSLSMDFMDYLGGSAPRKTVYEKVTTASGLPGNYSLALHQEMAYQAHRPDVLVLFCQTQSSEGGETPVADARQVTRRIDESVRQRFEQQDMRIRRSLPHTQLDNQVPRPWPEVLGSDSRERVDEMAQENSWKVEWRPNEALFLWQEVMTAFKVHPQTKERVWANQVHYHSPECWLKWAIRDNRKDDIEKYTRLIEENSDEVDIVCFLDGERVASDDVEHIWDVLVESEIPLKLQRNDVLICDNVLAMHGRSTFKGKRDIFLGLMQERM